MSIILTVSFVFSLEFSFLHKHKKSTASIESIHCYRFIPDVRKYDVLESHVLATIRVVAMARTWLPRLLRIAEAARQSEMKTKNKVRI